MTVSNAKRRILFISGFLEHLAEAASFTVIIGLEHGAYGYDRRAWWVWCELPAIEAFRRYRKFASLVKNLNNELAVCWQTKVETKGKIEWEAVPHDNSRFLRSSE